MHLLELILRHQVVSVFVLWDDKYFTTLHLSAISFTSLILTELIMVASEIHKWHILMVLAEGLGESDRRARVLNLVLSASFQCGAD